MHNRKTAILIFANSAAIDGARKGIPNCERLFEALNEDILKKVQRTTLPYFIYNEDVQIGVDFGARFTTAIQSVFGKGYDAVITLGNDSPNLTSQTLIDTYHRVKEGKTVVGPSTDGGVYLLGFHKNRFDACSFRNLPWQKQNLFEQIARYFLRRGMLHQLPRLTDIDAISDISTILRSGLELSSSLLFILVNIVRRKPVKNKYYSPNGFNGNALSNPYNKGSPLASFPF